MSGWGSIGSFLGLGEESKILLLIMSEAIRHLEVAYMWHTYDVVTITCTE